MRLRVPALAPLAVTSLAVVVLLLGALLVLLPQEPRPARPGRATPVLPFDLPSEQSLRSSDKLVLAHYFPPLPLSLDNEAPGDDYYARNYLDPEGEGGKHAPYGGHLRDRPLPRAPIPDEQWRLQDMRTEVRQAIAGGLDGFTLNLLQLEDGSDPRLWRNARLLLQAASDVDPEFKVVLMPDMAGSLVEESLEKVAEGVAQLADHPSAYRLDDGRLLMSPFKAEGHSAAWWKDFLQEMEDVHDIEVALLPTFVADVRRHVDEFEDISYGISSWGARNPEHNDPEDTGAGSQRSTAEDVQDRGLRWMQPVSVQDARPNQGIYDEAENTNNLRRTWQLARETDAELVQIATWNDYTEGTHLAPSMMHGWTFLDLSAYYVTWYKAGRPPEIVRDAVYVTHRTQPVDTEPAFQQDERMERRGGSPARDTVEALTFLTAPGTVEVRVGDETHSCEADAGRDTCTVPLGTGRVAARVLRDGATVASVTSPYEVTDEPYVQDLQYVGASSLRDSGEQQDLRP